MKEIECQQGNGAREALIQIFNREDYLDYEKAEWFVDHFLAVLWVDGYKIVPHTVE